MDSNIHLIFESKSHADSAKCLYPTWGDRIHYWRELFPDSIQAQTERLSVFSQWLDPAIAHRASSYLFTIEKLRESLVLSHEDIDYGFSELPETPRNEQIAALAHQYLDSALAEDWTALVWRYIEAIKGGDCGLPFEKARFVWGNELSYLFKEFSQTVLQFLEQEENEPVEFSDAFSEPTPNNRRYAPVTLTGSIEKALPTLMGLIKKAKKRNRAFSVCIHLNAQNKMLFNCALSSARIPFRYIDSTKSSEQTIEESLWTRIRRDNTIPLVDRLQIIHKLNEHSLSPTLESLESVSYLSEPEKAYLKTMRPREPTQTQPLSEPVLDVLPLTGMPTPNGYAFALVDESLTQPDRFPFCLEEAEIGKLNQLGFQIRTSFDLRRRHIDQLRLFQQGATPHRFLLSTFDDSKILPYRKKALTAPPPKPKGLAEDNFQVDFPSRPFSATQLENYAQCPSRYYFSNKLRLQTTKRAWEQKYALLFGTAVHSTLENAISQNPDLIPNEAVLKQEFDQVLSSESALQEIDGPVKQIMRFQFQKVAHKFPETEKRFRELFHSKPIAFEKAFDLEIDGIRVRGKIDRIDELQDGSQLVLDYKTGNVKFSPNQILTGNHFQALLYFLAMEQQAAITGMLFYDLKKSETKRGLLKENELTTEHKKEFVRGHILKPDKLELTLRAGQDHMKALSSEIAAGNYPPTPDSASCQFCEHSMHCQKGAFHESSVY